MPSDSATLDLMQQRLRQMALSPQLALAANPIPVRPKIGRPDSICNVCGATNPARNFRCKRCDAVIIKKKPNGKFEDQLGYVKDYLSEHSAYEKQIQQDKIAKRESRC